MLQIPMGMWLLHSNPDKAWKDFIAGRGVYSGSSTHEAGGETLLAPSKSIPIGMTREEPDPNPQGQEKRGKWLENIGQTAERAERLTKLAYGRYRVTPTTTTTSMANATLGAMRRALHPKLIDKLALM